MDIYIIEPVGNSDRLGSVYVVYGWCIKAVQLDNAPLYHCKFRGYPPYRIFATAL